MIKLKDILLEQYQQYQANGQKWIRRKKGDPWEKFNPKEELAKHYGELHFSAADGNLKVNGNSYGVTINLAGLYHLKVKSAEKNQSNDPDIAIEDLIKDKKSALDGVGGYLKDLHHNAIKEINTEKIVLNFKNTKVKNAMEQMSVGEPTVELKFSTQGMIKLPITITFTLNKPEVHSTGKMNDIELAKTAFLTLIKSTKLYDIEKTMKDQGSNYKHSNRQFSPVNKM